MRLSPDGSTFFVSDSSYSTGRIVAFDRDSHASRGAYVFPNASDLIIKDVELSRDGRSLYALAYYYSASDSYVFKFDIASHTLLTSTRLQTLFPGDLAVSPDDQSLWITSRTPNHIAILNAATFETRMMIHNIPRPFSVKFSPNGQFAYVNTDTTFTEINGVGTDGFIASLSGVLVINVSDASVASLIPVDGRPGPFAVSADGARLYVPKPSGNIAIIDVATRHIVGELTLPADWYASGTEITPDGRLLYVKAIAGGSGERVFVIDIASNLIIDALLDSQMLSASYSSMFLHSVSPHAACLADFNHDGSVSQQDLFDFLQAYHSGNMSADYARDGRIGPQDLFNFLAAYQHGC